MIPTKKGRVFGVGGVVQPFRPQGSSPELALLFSCLFSLLFFGVPLFSTNHLDPPLCVAFDPEKSGTQPDSNQKKRPLLGVQAGKQTCTWSLHDPLKMGPLPKIMVGPWDPFLFRVMETPGIFLGGGAFFSARQAKNPRFRLRSPQSRRSPAGRRPAKC